LYEQAEAASQQALQANADKSKFLAAASHDLRQPVHAQGLFLEVLGQTRLTPHQQDIVDSLRSATRATRDMLDSLLCQLVSICLGAWRSRPVARIHQGNVPTTVM
jgi:signal transduction histidine kinase